MLRSLAVLTGLVVVVMLIAGCAGTPPPPPTPAPILVVVTSTPASRPSPAVAPATLVPSAPTSTAAVEIGAAPSATPAPTEQAVVPSESESTPAGTVVSNPDSISGGLSTVTPRRIRATATPAPTQPTDTGESAEPSATPGPDQPAAPTAPPTSAGADALQAAVDRVAEEGYSVFDTSTYRDDLPLRVLIGIATGSATGYNKFAFFFLDDRYLGTDTNDASQLLDYVGQTADTIALSYGLYQPDDPNCCPTGGSAEVRFHWDGSRLTPLDSIPPSDWEAGLSRR